MTFSNPPPVDPDDVIELAFSLTRAEFARSRYVASFQSRSLRTLLLLFVILLAIGLVFPSTYGWFLGGLWLVALLGTLWLVPLVSWRRNEEFRAPRRIALRDSGVTISLPTAESRVEWVFFPSVIDAKTIYLLFHNLRLCTTIPKRVFASQDDEVAFVALLLRHGTMKKTVIL